MRMTALVTLVTMEELVIIVLVDMSVNVQYYMVETSVSYQQVSAVLLFAYFI